MVAPRFFPPTGPQQLDSPLSNVDLTTPMADVPQIKALQEGARPTADAASVAKEFSKDLFVDQTLPLDVRLSMMSFVRFRAGFPEVAEAFSQHLFKKPFARLDPKELRGDQALLFGYLIASDVTTTQKALPFFDAAKKKMPESFAAASFAALARAQMRLKADPMNSAPAFCAAWKLMETPLKDKALRTDIRFTLVEQIYDNVTNYKESCPKQGK